MVASTYCNARPQIYCTAICLILKPIYPMTVRFCSCCVTASRVRVILVPPIKGPSRAPSLSVLLTSLAFEVVNQNLIMSQKSSKTDTGSVSGKSTKGVKKSGSRGPKKARKETFSSYIYKGTKRLWFETFTHPSIVLKQIHPDSGISNKAMSIMNSFVNGLW